MKATFFDANGVLYFRVHGQRFFQAFLQELGLQMPDVHTLKVATAEIHDQALRGQVSNNDYFNAVLRFCGVTNPSLMVHGRAALDRDHGDIQLFGGVKETLVELKTRGFKLGIVTDAAVPKAKKLEWFEANGLNIYWDAYANSMDLGVRKPDRAMYQEALSQAGVFGGETVFVGHDRRELEGAKAVGLMTIAFNYDREARADFYIEDFPELINLPFLQQADIE
ncbi:MAG: HAD hydrolase-like protein [Anaerolineales bacterium]|nr:HAD hydrolase-like protein [Anaerolineales bacterium]